MKIGLLQERKIPEDKRVVLTPQQCKEILDIYSNIELVVESSKTRCFTDNEYSSVGINVVNDISDCDILFGVKEIPEEFLIANKKYFYFSHTIKKQPYNRNLLAKMIEMNITMIDYEALKNIQGDRLVGFGKYAGIVGAYNGFLTYGLKSDRFILKPAFQCRDRKEMEGELSKIFFNNEKIVITGKGRVGKGIIEIMEISGVLQVTVDEFINQTFDKPVYVQLDTLDFNERVDGLKSEKLDFYNHPELYRSSFKKFTNVADIFIAGHYYASGSPCLFTREDIRSDDFNLKVVADISCDIDGPVASTIRSSTISNPIYGYNPVSEKEIDFRRDDAIAVMAVSNLPCELPKDASEDFGNEILYKVIPSLFNGDKNKIIYNATICSDGDLNPDFEYLRDYIDGI